MWFLCALVGSLAHAPRTARQDVAAQEVTPEASFATFRREGQAAGGAASLAEEAEGGAATASLAAGIRRQEQDQGQDKPTGMARTAVKALKPARDFLRYFNLYPQKEADDSLADRSDVWEVFRALAAEMDGPTREMEDRTKSVLDEVQQSVARLGGGHLWAPDIVAPYAHLAETTSYQLLLGHPFSRQLEEPHGEEPHEELFFVAGDDARARRLLAGHLFHQHLLGPLLAAKREKDEARVRVAPVRGAGPGGFVALVRSIEAVEEEFYQRLQELPAYDLQRLHAWDHQMQGQGHSLQVELIPGLIDWMRSKKAALLKDQITELKQSAEGEMPEDSAPAIAGQIGPREAAWWAFETAMHWKFR